MLDTNEMLDFFNDWNNDPEPQILSCGSVEINNLLACPTSRIEQHLTELKAEDNTYITFAKPAQEALATQSDFDELRERILELSNTIDEIKTSIKPMVVLTEHRPRGFYISSLQKQYSTASVIGLDMAKEDSDVKVFNLDFTANLNPSAHRSGNSCDFIFSNPQDQISDVQKLKDEKLAAFKTPPEALADQSGFESIEKEKEKENLESLENLESFEHAMALVS